MSEKLLNESTVKRFMKLANLSPMSNSFLEEEKKKTTFTPVADATPAQGGSSGKPESEETKMDRKLDDTNPAHRAYIASVVSGGKKGSANRAKAYDAYMANPKNAAKWEKKNESVEPLEEKEKIDVKKSAADRDRRRDVQKKAATQVAGKPGQQHLKKDARGKVTQHEKDNPAAHKGSFFAKGSKSASEATGEDGPVYQVKTRGAPTSQGLDVIAKTEDPMNESLQRESVFNSDYILQETLKRVILNLKGSK